MSRLTRRGPLGLALLALAATALPAAPASASVTNTEIVVNAFINKDSSCTYTGASSGPPHVTWSDNGVPVTHSYATSGTINKPATTDITDASASVSATLTATPLGNGPARIDGRVQLRASAVARQAGSVCGAGGYAYADGGGEFTLSQPMWATVSVNSPGGASGAVIARSLGSGNRGSAHLFWGDILTRANGSLTSLLPAGPTAVDFTADVEVESDGSGPRTVSDDVTFSIDLQPMGAASAVSGKGRRFVQPGARDCSNGAIAAVVTKKAKKQAKQVLITVNGAKVAKLKGKKVKPRALALPAASGAAATVTAKVVLKNGKKATVTRSYLACS
jgi:hypothetical protein